MGRQILGYENYADDAGAVYSGGSWQVPLDNLKSPIVSNKARSTNLDLASTQFSIDLGQNRELALWCLTHTNLSEGALIRLTWYDSSAVVIAATGWVAVNAYPEIDPDFIGAAHFHVFEVPPTARSGLCEIDDASNTDGFVEIGRNFMCRELGIARNPDISASDDMEANTQKSSAPGGTRYSNRQTPLRKYAFGYNVITDDDDAAAKIRRLRRYCGLDKQVIIIPDVADTANYFERNFVGELNAMPQLTLLECDLVGGSGFEILEVV